MSITFSLADPDIYRIIDRLLPAWNPELDEVGGKVAVLFVESEDGEPALKNGGYPAAAIVSIVPLVQRMFVRHDALIRIDHRAWCELPDRCREALLAHELLHLEVVKDLDPSPGAPWWKTDDIGRPKLKIRPADWNGGDGWKSIVEHYGQEAIEMRNLNTVRAVAEPALKNH